MPNDDILTDDYVADLLAKEAQDCSLKYSSMGMDAYRSNQRPTNQPKPNTRFLNNIIRDTNSHNRAILAQERAEAQARLKSLEEAEREKQRRHRPGPGDTRKRMLGDIASILGSSSKRQKSRSDGDTDRRHKDPAESRRHASSRSSRADEQSETRYSSSRSNRTAEDDSNSRGGESRRHGHKRRHRSRSRSEEREMGSRDRKRRSTQPETDERQRKDKRRSRDLFDDQPSKKRSSHRDASPQPSEPDSDPLEDLIGPAPAPKMPSEVRTRGRGTHASSSGIDRRFSASYDPSLDVNRDTEGDDWEESLEALRNRREWQKQGADRLLAAGFTEDEVQRWEKGGQRDVEDVRWKKKGESREWDRGKVLLEDAEEGKKKGDVITKPEWGRLTVDDEDDW